MGVQPAFGQVATLSGRVVTDDAEEPIEFASILLSESGLWAITDERGRFAIKNVPHGKLTLTVQCLGYQKRTWPMTSLDLSGKRKSSIATPTIRMKGTSVIIQSILPFSPVLVFV